MKPCYYDGMLLTDPNGIFMEDLDGCSVSCNIVSSETNGFDGSTLTSEAVPMRNITMTLLLSKESHIQTVYDTFKIKQYGIFQYGDKQIFCRVESVDIPRFAIPKKAMISLLCPQPYFTDLEQVRADIAAVIGGFEFPFEIPAPQSGTGQTLSFTGLTEGDEFHSLTVYGHTTETGTGTKSPDNPYTLSGVGEVVISDGGENLQTVSLPQTLYSLPNGVRDEYDVAAGSGTKRVGKIIIDGNISNQIIFFPNESVASVAGFVVVGMPNIKVGGARISDKLQRFTDSPGINSEGIFWNITVNQTIHILKSRISGWDDSLTSAQKVTLFRTWLSSNPITVIYELATPEAITGEPQELPVYIPNTTISVSSGEIYAEVRGGIELSVKSYSLIVNVTNSGSVDTGMDIVFYANSSLSNPSLIDVNTQEFMKIRYDMLAGDTIKISTYKGKKSITLIRGGTEANLFNYRVAGSKFLQLYANDGDTHTGDNLLRYNADSNPDGLEVTIYHSNYYAGV